VYQDKAVGLEAFHMVEGMVEDSQVEAFHMVEVVHYTGYQYIAFIH